MTQSGGHEVPLRLHRGLGPPPAAAPPVRRRGRRLPDLLPVAGLAAALAGAILAATGPSDGAGLRDDGLQIGPLRLRPLGGGVYGDGPVVMVGGLPDRWRTAGSARIDGRPVTGTCVMALTTAHCTFASSGGPPLRSEDVLTTGVWHRRYSDGIEVHISVVGRAVPIPLPIGR